MTIEQHRDQLCRVPPWWKNLHVCTQPSITTVHLYLVFCICRFNQLQIGQYCYIYQWKKNLCISEPAQFKFMLFKDQLDFVPKQPAPIILVILIVVFSVLFGSVAQSCPTLCISMDCSTPGFPVHHQLQELAQTPVQGVSDAIQPSHPLSTPSPALSLYQRQGLYQ